MHIIGNVLNGVGPNLIGSRFLSKNKQTRIFSLCGTVTVYGLGCQTETARVNARGVERDKSLLFFIP